MVRDAYEGDMPDHWFRKLNAKEEIEFRQHTRKTYTEELPESFRMYHPVVRDEWRKMDLEKGVKR